MTDPTIRLAIDGQSVTVPAGTTILKAAEQVGNHIPTICYHDHCTANGLCRMCVVEVEGARLLQPACVAPVAEGMQVRTQNARGDRARPTLLEMLHSAVDLSEAPEILTFMGQYLARKDRFPEAERREHPLLDDNQMYVRDYSKCILRSEE